MNTFKNQAAQGDLLFIRVDNIPAGIEKVEPVDGVVVIGHSETGHHHVMDAKTTTMYRLPNEIYEAFLVVDTPTKVEHRRSFDTHEPIMLDEGVYKMRRQREYTPEGFRRVED